MELSEIRARIDSVDDQLLNLFLERFPHHPALVGGILEEECRQVLSDFFKGLRK